MSPLTIEFGQGNQLESKGKVRENSGKLGYWNLWQPCNCCSASSTMTITYPALNASDAKLPPYSSSRIQTPAKYRPTSYYCAHHATSNNRKVPESPFNQSQSQIHSEIDLSNNDETFDEEEILSLAGTAIGNSMHYLLY